MRTERLVMTPRRESDVVRRPSLLPWKHLEPDRRTRIIFALKECRAEFEWDIANRHGFFQSILKCRFWSCREADSEHVILKSLEFTGFLVRKPIRKILQSNWNTLKRNRGLEEHDGLLFAFCTEYRTRLQKNAEGVLS